MASVSGTSSMTISGTTSPPGGAAGSAGVVVVAAGPSVGAASVPASVPGAASVPGTAGAALVAAAAGGVAPVASAARINLNPAELAGAVDAGAVAGTVETGPS